MSNEGKFVWSDLTIPNADKVRDFYSEVFNWTAEEVDMGGYSDYSMKNENGEVVGGICFKKGMNNDFPPFWINYISVSNIKETLDKAQKLGAEIIVPPNPESSYKMAVIKDNAGAFIGIFEEQKSD